MNTEDIRRAMPRPEVLKMQIVADGLEVEQVMPGRVLVEPVKPRTKLDEVEAGGLLVIPKAAKDEHTPTPSTGIVVATGAGVPEEIYPGAMVLFSKYTPQVYTIDKKEFFVLDHKDIACTLRTTDGLALSGVIQRVEDKAEGLQ